jgi:hypothetical protein
MLQTLKNATHVALWPVAFQPSDLFQNTCKRAAWSSVYLYVGFCVFGVYIIVKGARGMTALNPEFKTEKRWCKIRNVLLDLFLLTN